VIAPVLDGGEFLRHAERTRGKRPPPARWELIVVDDASSDDSPVVAARMRTGWCSPGHAERAAYARNRGAEVACGRHLVFIDADVRLHPTLCA